jgi:serine-type D-Ala-D-Ala carboxypeptidase/endopeptidase (penicillin-binding protein 4)
MRWRRKMMLNSCLAMARARKYPLVLLLLLLVAAQEAVAADRKPLSERIEEILTEPHLIRTSWGIEIVSLSSGKRLYSHNAEKLFTPASTTKLFTTAAALALIGPEYKFRTTVETAGTLDRHGRLTGDLVLVGRGDPNLSGHALPYRIRSERGPPAMWVLEELADQLAARGVRFVDGDVVGDDSFFAFERYAESWTRDDLVQSWGAPVSAISVNDNVVAVTVLPADRVGERAFVSIAPFPEYFQVDNRILTTPTGTAPRSIFFNREPGSNLLTLWGHIPLDDAGVTYTPAIENPADYAARLFRRLLERRGITVYGGTRTRHTELASLSTLSVTSVAAAGGGTQSAAAWPVAPQPLELASHESAPVLQGMTVINKVSQNLHAEMLLRLLGRERGAGGTIEGGLEVLRSFSLQAGIQSDEYVFYDGSGLSRQNLATPEAVLKLLRYAAEQPWFEAYRDTLPIAGVDGSLAYRFRGSVANGRVQAKTGSLGSVNALSGYATTLSGERVAFSIIANNHNLPSSRALQSIDAIVEALVDDVRFTPKEEKKDEKKRR